MAVSELDRWSALRQVDRFRPQVVGVVGKFRQEQLDGRERAGGVACRFPRAPAGAGEGLLPPEVARRGTSAFPFRDKRELTNFLEHLPSG
jgi:hypothetical protein